MDRPVTSGADGSSPHHLVNPQGLIPASGFSHAVVASPGRTVYLGGQTGHESDGSISGRLLEQTDRALQNVVTALRAAGGEPRHLVSVQIFVTQADEYRSQLSEIGKVWRRHLGPHYPAVSLFEVTGLFDPEARVEILCTAVITEAETPP